MTFLSIIGWLAWIATIGSISGQIFVTFKKPVGFIIWLLSALFWICISCITVNIPQIVLWAFFAGMDIWSYIMWKRCNK